MPGKPYSEWDEDYLQNELPIEIKGTEHDWIELKASFTPDDLNKLRNELSKQLSAFGNAEGGCVVFGLRDDCSIDGGVRTDIKNDTKEWLERIIPDQTMEQTTSFNVYPIKSKQSNSKINSNCAVYVVEIRPHEKAPIQAKFDQKFYLRIAGQSLPMSKQQIFDIANRQKHPELTISKMKFIRTKLVGSKTDIQEIEYTLEVTLKNTGEIMARNIGLELVIPDCLHPSPLGNKVMQHWVKHYQEQGYMKHIFYMETPIFPNQELPVSFLRLNFSRDLLRGKFKSEPKPLIYSDHLVWILHADSSPLTYGHFVPSELEDFKSDIFYMGDDGEAYFGDKQDPRVRSGVPFNINEFLP